MDGPKIVGRSNNPLNPRCIHKKYNYEGAKILYKLLEVKI
jgi:hypothetical protein